MMRLTTLLLFAFCVFCAPACARKEAARAQPARELNTGKLEETSRLIVELHPSLRGRHLRCVTPLGKGSAPYMDCEVEGEGQSLLDVRVEYRGSRPYLVQFWGELVNTERLTALQDPQSPEFGSSAQAAVLSRLAVLQPHVERFIGRELGEPDLTMRRVQLPAATAPTMNVVVWRATYRTGVAWHRREPPPPTVPATAPAGFIDIEPIGGSIVRVEF